MSIWKPALFCALTLGGSPALSCAFHGYTPQPTLVDRLMASDHVVLARSASGDPFRFKASAAIEGPLASVDIPHLVDTTTRRRLAIDQTAQVLFARDGAYGPWERMAFVDAEFDPVLSDIVERLPRWMSGDDADRFGFFAGLLNHPDPVIHELALRELDQADYALLKSLDLDVPVDRLLDRLDVLSEMNLKPIRLLLLGLSDRSELAGLMEHRLRSLIGTGGTNLGAYATALLEQRGSASVTWVAGELLSDPTASMDSKEALIAALAIQSTVPDSGMSFEIQHAMDLAVTQDPRLAAAVARQFGQRFDWSLDTSLAKVLRQRQLDTISDLMVVSQYLALAGAAQTAKP